MENEINLNVEKILTGLKQCAAGDCDESCPYFAVQDDCVKPLMQEAATLIIAQASLFGEVTGT